MNLKIIATGPQGSGKSIAIIEALNGLSESNRFRWIDRVAPTEGRSEDGTPQEIVEYELTLED